MRLRAATYNVRSFRRGVRAAAEALGDPPDILLLQECANRRQTDRFARELEMEFVSPHRPLSRVRNAVLFRPPWRAVHARAHELSRRGGTPPRGFVAARLRAGSVRLTAVSAHLGLSPREREHHARELTDALLGTEGPLLVGADLNEGSEEPAARWVAGRLYDAFAGHGEGAGLTFPAAAPSARIDYLFTGEGVETLRCWVVTGEAAWRASDHLPLVAELEIEEPR